MKFIKKNQIKFFINSNSNIKQALANLEKNTLKITLVVDDANKFFGTITDGDIRRGLLKGLNLGDSLRSIVNKKSYTIKNIMDERNLIKIMSDRSINHVPLLDYKNKVIGMYVNHDRDYSARNIQNSLLIMAGGKGLRMLPHTQHSPKPMMLVKKKPILEHIILRAKQEGFKKIWISVHYLGSIIKDYFNDGKKWGVEIKYISEKKPYGTAGSLAHIKPKPKLPIVVINGDLLTSVNYQSIINYHIKHKALATMAVKILHTQNQFGVIKTKGINVVNFIEKPINKEKINAGIYVISPKAINMIDKKNFEMNELFLKLKKQRKKIIIFPLHESWKDIGRPQDLSFVNKKKNKL